ncbi:hypothetical protein FISHEDRAFT_77160 [Fistulina hepatica ATCC 64428]|uniref:Uncharacterized protein n=1 Tax=Fistulina hepatica ATCC 64428 TaxID=1128425 RepID=A0A0D7A1X3_9AGAR|nr:hypothetical protein FISHEDRAFT_77160 [Fistulina hepatica ATCC 64428]
MDLKKILAYTTEATARHEAKNTGAPNPNAPFLAQLAACVHDESESVKWREFVRHYCENKREVVHRGHREVRKELRELIQTGLNEITGHRVTMNYESYEQRIVLRHGVDLKGTPNSCQCKGVNLKNPGTLRIDEQHDWLAMFQKEECKWVRLDEDELAERRARYESISNERGEARKKKTTTSNAFSPAAPPGPRSPYVETSPCSPSALETSCGALNQTGRSASPSLPLTEPGSPSAGTSPYSLSAFEASCGALNQIGSAASPSVPPTLSSHTPQ